MDISKVCNALSSDKRLKLISILLEGDLSGVEIYKRYNLKYSGKAHRETIYRDLELLHSVGIIDKKYDSSEKKLFYHLKAGNISINLLSNSITIGS